MANDVYEWISSCDQCQRKKFKNRQNAFLQPCPVPATKLADLAFDFFKAPSPLAGKDTILLVVDRLTKYLFPARPRTLRKLPLDGWVKPFYAVQV